MKKIIACLSIVSCLAVCLLTVNTNKAYADTTTVSGTIDNASGGDVLKLNTPTGQMELKIDSNTDFSNCKCLLPGQQVTVNITYGSDAYWHAASFKEGASSVGVKVDTSNISTVTGKITGMIANDIIKLQLKEGEMDLKLDDTTDFSGARFLMAGNTYSVRVAYGSDAYMHAVSISDTSASIGGGYSTSSYITPSTQVAASTTVSGTVGSKSDSNLLYLNTSDGEMQIKLDALNKAHVLYHGQKISVSIGYENEYWHAVSITE